MAWVSNAGILGPRDLRNSSDSAAHWDLTGSRFSDGFGTVGVDGSQLLDLRLPERSHSVGSLFPWEAAHSRPAL